MARISRPKTGGWLADFQAESAWRGFMTRKPVRF